MKGGKAQIQNTKKVQVQTWHAWRWVWEGGVQPPGQRWGVWYGGNGDQLGNIGFSVDPGKPLPAVWQHDEITLFGHEDCRYKDVRILMLMIMRCCKPQTAVLLCCRSQCLKRSSLKKRKSLSVWSLGWSFGNNSQFHLCFGNERYTAVAKRWQVTGWWTRAERYTEVAKTSANMIYIVMAKMELSLSGH